MTARSRTQPKPSQELHDGRILEKVDSLACRCCQSETLDPSVIVNPEYPLMEHKTLAHFQRELPGERRRRANTQAEKSAGEGAENIEFSTAVADLI